MMAFQRSVPVLTFHALDELPDAISFSAAAFQRGMERLYRAGYQAVDLMEVAERARSGRRFPPCSFAISFDDGYRSVFDQAFPVLRGLGMAATIFLTVGQRPDRHPDSRLPPLNGREMLSWREIREMQRAGIAFGAHTLTHPDLTRLPLSQVEAETYQSQQIIEDALGIAVRSFAYPFGRYNRRCREVVRERFFCAFSDRLGLTGPRGDPYALERLDAYYLRNDRLFSLMLGPLLAWYVSARAVPRSVRRALLPWP